MRRMTMVLLFLVLIPSAALAEEFVTRAEGFHFLWEPLKRPAEETSERPFSDVPESNPNYLVLTFAKARGILDDGSEFYPDEPLRLNDALVWLFRTRNVAAPDDVNYQTVQELVERYSLLLPEGASAGERSEPVAQNTLSALGEALDRALREEVHSISFYSDEFAGDHTAFGEVFDPNALTAAHKTFPLNTLVKVTNQDNGKNVVVRVNDRGPFVPGRSMDLARAAFERISNLSSGVLHNVTLERLGSADVVNACPSVRYQRRLGATLLSPGIPNVAEIGSSLTLTADRSFRLLQMRKPGAPPKRSKEWTNELLISFDTEGIYTFVLHEDGGSRRRFRTRVTQKCEL